MWVNLICVGWLKCWYFNVFLFFGWMDSFWFFLFFIEGLVILFCDEFEWVIIGLIFVDIVVEVEIFVFLEIEFVLFVVLLDENVKKLVVGEGMFNFMFVLVCEMIFLREMVEDVFVWIDKVCEYIEVFEFFLEGCFGGVRKFWNNLGFLRKFGEEGNVFFFWILIFGMFVEGRELGFGDGGIK